ncbi:uncharacterized protein LOC108037798 [Drosophila rhopaloa]|uniref:Uncharacterized protein n=1 Tax=Drosophila rhopaloa TaxID=1041015 RepID=A0ABM5GV43_DRORH|nr:uncharacterized protein LOC108037798 [Drosophila rhopaloa]XP_016969927.2 uncharacterized protein LOC108037798 [Drosophila rhopaloa]
MSDSEKVVDEFSNEILTAVEPRETIWYSIGQLVEMIECPGCGKSMVSFKNRFAHVKKCFSIKRRGPLYRIHGYAECKCGLLIADTAKAQKLHVCMGKVRPCKPSLPVEPEKPPAEAQPPEELPSTTKKSEPVQILEQTVKPQSKTWIRNFICPIKQKELPFLDVSCSNETETKPTSRPRVRNFDKPSRVLAPKDVCVYSIIRKNGAISVAGRSILTQRGSNENIVLIKKRKLRLPAIKQSGKS